MKEQGRTEDEPGRAIDRAHQEQHAKQHAGLSPKRGYMMIFATIARFTVLYKSY